MRSALSNTVALGAILAGCGSSPVPAEAPPAPTSPPPVALATSAPPAPAAPSGVPSSAPSAAPIATAPPLPKLPVRPAPPALEEPLLPINRAFVKITLPGVKDPLISVSGTGPRDLVFLSQEAHQLYSKYQYYRGTVIRSDGARVIDHQVPCAGYEYHHLVAAGDEVLVEGSNIYFRNVPPGHWASLTGKKSWGCTGHTRGSVAVSGGRVWKLSCEYDGIQCTLSADGAPDIPLPRFDASFGYKDTPAADDDLYWMSAPDDGFLTHPDGEGRISLLRYNGVTWSVKASLEGLDPVSMWVDADNQVWILARRGGEKEPGNAILRYRGGALEELSVPVGFGASMIRASGPRDLWFVGLGRAIFQWDGDRLRRGWAPFDVGDAWAAPGGELWIVGHEDEASPGPGVAAHTVPAAGERH